MRQIGLAAILIIRIAALLVGLWQIVTLLPVLGWISGPEPIPVGHWLVVLIKAVILAICAGLFFGLRKLRRKLLPGDRTESELERNKEASALVEEFKRKEREFEESVAAQLRNSKGRP